MGGKKFDFASHAKAIIKRPPQKVSISLLHEEAMRILEKERKIRHKELTEDFTRMTLMASDMLLTVDKDRRAGLLKELAKAIYRGVDVVAAKDLLAVIKSGKENLESLQKGNYGVTVKDGLLYYSYWDYCYVVINTRLRQLNIIRKPEVRTATGFIKKVMESYGLVYDKECDVYTLPERIV